MSDMNMRRRDFAAAALLAFTPASALARIKVTSGNRRGGGKKSTDPSRLTDKECTELLARLELRMAQLSGHV